MLAIDFGDKDSLLRVDSSRVISLKDWLISVADRLLDRGCSTSKEEAKELLDVSLLDLLFGALDSVGVMRNGLLLFK